MTEPLALPPGLALGIIAFLLSLLPAGVFVWLWYLRRRDRALPARLVATAFLGGLVLVAPAFWLEDLAGSAWDTFFPATSHYFFGTALPLLTWRDILLPAVGTFFVVAIIEEGVRYGLLRTWLRFAKTGIDQVFDGLVLGVAVGVGFATLENTLYFLNLFREGSYDTLVFVFFLRFLISTLAHISFAGLMGALLARDTFEFLAGRRFAVAAFLIPWFLHGLFDWLIAVHLGIYAVLLLLPPLLTLTWWASRADSFVVHRRGGTLLPAGEVQENAETRAVSKVLENMGSPWNKYAPWLNQAAAQKRIKDLTADEKT